MGFKNFQGASLANICFAGSQAEYARLHITYAIILTWSELFTCYNVHIYGEA